MDNLGLLSASPIRGIYIHASGLNARSLRSACVGAADTAHGKLDALNIALISTINAHVFDCKYHAVDVPILLQLYFSKAFHCFGLPEAAPRRAAGNACLKKRSSRASWLDAILIPFIAYSRKETDNGVIHSF